MVILLGLIWYYNIYQTEASSAYKYRMTTRNVYKYRMTIIWYSPISSNQSKTKHIWEINNLFYVANNGGM